MEQKRNAGGELHILAECNLRRADTSCARPSSRRTELHILAKAAIHRYARLACRAEITFTDSLTPGSSAIRALHLNELRAAVQSDIR